MAAFALPALAQQPPIDRIKVPPGFEVTIFAANVKDARSMALGDQNLPGGGGTLFVGTRTAGSVYAIRHDGRKASEVLTLASGLNMPNGVAVKDGALYVAEVNRVIRFDAVEVKLPKDLTSRRDDVTLKFFDDSGALPKTLVNEVALHWNSLHSLGCGKDLSDATAAVVAARQLDGLYQQALASATRSYCQPI